MSIVRQLGPADALALMRLRRQALEQAPLAFAASLEDDRVLSMDLATQMLADAESQAVFGHFSNSELTGMVGLLRGMKHKHRHKAGIWGMYVVPQHRKQGIARMLLLAAIERARAWNVEQVQLTVSDAATEAMRLYESAGFRSWGCEPRALQWQGRCVDEHHLVLELRG